MRYLLDTHTLVWWLINDIRLSSPARVTLADGDNEVYVGAVSAFEMATKHRLGKWPEAGPVCDNFNNLVVNERFTFLPVETSHALHAGRLIVDHKDPFDRLLAAQSILEGLVLLSADEAFDSFGVRRLW